MKVNSHLSGAVRKFAYWFAHGTLGHPILDEIPYVGEIMKEGRKQFCGTSFCYLYE